MKYYVNENTTISAPSRFWKALDPGEEVTEKYIEEYKKLKAWDTLLKEKSIISENDKKKSEIVESKEEIKSEDPKKEVIEESKDSKKALKFGKDLN